MKMWDCFGHVKGGKYLGRFEAPTEEEAKKEASRKAFVSLCHRCSGECEDAEIIEITAEEV